jgi:outer membrane protein TolC
MRKTLSLFALFSLVELGLSACALGPTYRTPPIPPKGGGAFVSASPDISAPQAPPEDWWRLYDDPVLDRLIQRAFAANTDLRAAEANLGAARGVLDQARAGLFPSTTLAGGAAYGRSASADAAAATATEVNNAFAPNGGGVTAFGPTQARAAWVFDPSFDVSYEVDLFGRVRLRRGGRRRPRVRQGGAGHL